MQFLFKLTFALLLGLLLGVVAVAQERSGLLKNIDERVSILRRDTDTLVSSGTYFQVARELLDFINRSAIDPMEKYDRIQSVVADAVAVPARSGGRKEALIRERRNILLVLLGARLDEVEQDPNFTAIRSRYARSLVDFVSSLKIDVIPEYQPRPVSVNMSMDGRDNDAVRAEKYRVFLVEAHRNNDLNRYQEALKSELQFLAPKVASFLKDYYKYSGSDQVELQRLLSLLS